MANEENTKDIHSVDSEDLGDLAELDAMFGQDDADVHEKENVVLTQNLDGFASCFPSWDLHPPVFIREDRTAAGHEPKEGTTGFFSDGGGSRRKRGS